LRASDTLVAGMRKEFGGVMEWVECAGV